MYLCVLDSLVCSLQTEDEMTHLSVRRWAPKNVAKWLTEEGFCEYVDLLCNKHRLDGTSLLALSEYDLRSPPLELQVLGDIKRLMVSIRKLQKQNMDLLEELGLPFDGHSPTGSGSGLEWLGNGDSGRDCDSTNTAPVGEEYHQYTNGKYKQQTRRLDPEYWKTVLSSVYVVFVFGFTSFVMVIVHERVPDMRTYPPLPDIFLDRWEDWFWALRSSLTWRPDRRCFSSSPTVCLEYRGPSPWPKRVASSFVASGCWSCCSMNTGRVPDRGCGLVTPWALMYLPNYPQVHPLAADVQPDGDRVHAALRHHVCHLALCAGTAPAVLRKGGVGEGALSRSFYWQGAWRHSLRLSLSVLVDLRRHVGQTAASRRHLERFWDDPYGSAHVWGLHVQRSHCGAHHAQLLRHRVWVTALTSV